MQATHSKTCGAFVSIDSPLGSLLAASVEEGICLLAFEADDGSGDAALARIGVRVGRSFERGWNGHLHALVAELRGYFAGEPVVFCTPVARVGTAFQESVWAALRRIPHGETATYDDVARAVGRAGAQRAVGAACGANPVAIVTPCHRVVRTGGGLGGYAGGLHRKRSLLEIERAGAAHRLPA